ncbi:hypothetical protein GGX14DRAFT_595003 [Mycena pura]|uniref:Uncharacterized protein n=1 Tax=Mycena pura TaxID=153505 RepID=A0AAD6VSQ7_9AGAR|nr:hypothetical protein GGX14DRAFT_595003 [Mycena pura]
MAWRKPFCLMPSNWAWACLAPKFRKGLTDGVYWKAPGVLWYPATFIKYHKRAAPQYEYEFQWFGCNDGTIYRSEDSILPLPMLQRFFRERKFCEEIEDIVLTVEQLGKVRLPFYPFPDYPDHQNSELETIFKAAVPQVAKILVTFDAAHPVIGNFIKHFDGQPLVQRRLGVAARMNMLHLAPTPELEKFLDLPYLVSCCIIRYISDGPKALEAMFAAIAMSGSNTNVKSGTVVQQMLDFNITHAFHDPDFRPPTFRRKRPSIITPTMPIPVVLKWKRDAKIDGEKQAKRAKTSKNGKNTEATIPQVKGTVWGKRLRTRTVR